MVNIKYILYLLLMWKYNIRIHIVGYITLAAEEDKV